MPLLFLCNKLFVEKFLNYFIFLLHNVTLSGYNINIINNKNGG